MLQFKAASFIFQGLMEDEVSVSNGTFSRWTKKREILKYRLPICFMIRLIAVFLFICSLSLLVQAQEAAPFPGETSDFAGFTQYDFGLEGMQCRVVAPKIGAEGKPWIWRARFFGHRKEVDAALLERGFHVAYVDVAHLYGSRKAIMRWNRFYRYLTNSHDFNPKPALEGMSRGGLIVFNWASENPDKVSCIYADAPVCDFKSWPGGKMKSSSGNGPLPMNQLWTRSPCI